jgi:hypothetical protein
MNPGEYELYMLAQEANAAKMAELKKKRQKIMFISVGIGIVGLIAGVTYAHNRGKSKVLFGLIGGIALAGLSQLVGSKIAK